MHQIVSAPVNARQMLLAFAMYNAEKGLPSLTDRIDFTGVTRRQIYFNTFGRAPGPAVAADGPDFNARAATTTALQGDEFQLRLREIVLNAFPEKRRVIFVHVPKCAGTDMQTTLERQYPSLNQHLCQPETTNRPTLFQHLHHFAVGILLADSIAVCGHQSLRWYLDRSLVRFEDDVFTFIRHPRDLLYSYVSFILTRAVENAGRERRDVAHWLSEIGLETLEPNPSAGYLAELGRQLLRIRKPNIICHYLGTGTAASAFTAMRQSDIEITDVARYSEWRRRRFGFEPAQRVNPSKPLFTPEVATKADRELIDGMIAEDMIVYEALQEKLRGQDGLSVRGRCFD